MTGTKDRLDPRVVRTRNLLKKALLSLIPEKNYHKITIQDITDRADLNRVTFYLHYDNKDDLLKKATFEIFNELTRSHQLPNYDGSVYSYKQSRNIIKANFEFLQENQAFYSAMIGPEGVLSFIREMEDYIYESNISRVQAIWGKAPETTIDIKIILRHLATGFIGIASWWLENDQPYSPEEMADMLIAISRDGYFRCLGYQVGDEGFTLP